MKTYNVLWIDDRCKTESDFITNAELVDIIITPFETSEAGMKAFEKDLFHWDGIVLDAKCWIESSDETADTDAMHKSIDKITELKYKRKVPYFIYTGQPDLQSDTQFEKSLRGQGFYVKGRDEEKLIKNIKTEADKLPETQICHRYSASLEVCTDKYIGNNCKNELIDILLNIHGHKEINPNAYYTQLRIILEYVFRAANMIGLLHDACIGRNGKVNLTESSLFLAGEPANLLHVKCLKTHFPKILADNIKNLLFVTGGASHTTIVEDKDIINFQSYNSVVNTPYLLYSLTYIICDVLIWYKQYADINSDVSINKSLWISLPKVGDKLEIETDADGNFHCGDFCLVDKRQGANLIGKNVTITKLNNNTDRNTNAKYLYFATVTL